MNAESTMVAYYAQRAQEYERIYAQPERQDDLRQLRRLVEKTLAGRHVLDLACGTGYWTEVLARSAAAITAVDINDEVLDIARAKPLERHIAKFQRADVYALPAFPAPFTGCLAAFWWSHVPRPRLPGFLHGLHRVLAPGATVVFMDNLWVADSSTPISRQDADGNTYQRRKLDDGTEHEVLKNFPTEQALCSAIGDAAAELRIEFLKHYWILTYAVKGR